MSLSAFSFARFLFTLKSLDWFSFRRFPFALLFCFYATENHWDSTRSETNVTGLLSSEEQLRSSGLNHPKEPEEHLTSVHFFSHTSSYLEELALSS